MITLNKAVLSTRKAPKEGVTLTFDNGLHKIEQKQKYLFEFLTLKNQYIESGEFKINDIDFAQNEDNEIKSGIFYLAINSQVFCLSICVTATAEEKVKTLKAIQDELITLRNMPLENDEQIKDKIKKIMDIVLKYPLGYILFDQTNEINEKHLNIIEKVLKPLHKKACFVYLERNLNEEEINTAFDVSVDGDKKEKETDKSSSGFSAIKKECLALLKKDASLYAFIALETLFIVFLAQLSQYYFSTDNAVWGVVVIIVMIAFIVVEVLFVNYAVEFIDKCKSFIKQKLIFVTALMLLACVIGIGAAYGIFFAFQTNNIIIQKDKFDVSMLTTSYFISAITIIVPLLAKPIHLFINYIKSKIHAKK